MVYFIHRYYLSIIPFCFSVFYISEEFDNIFFNFQVLVLINHEQFVHYKNKVFLMVNSQIAYQNLYSVSL